MDFKIKKYQILLIVVWYLFTFWLWSTPYQGNKMPYGEYDAISHWMVGDNMAVNNQPLVYLPPYIALRYGSDNQYKPGTLWYHPPYHTNFAIVDIAAGERIIPTYIMNTLYATMFVLILFFIMYKFFGFWPGMASAVLATFSPRDWMVYLWGQWPERISYAFVPLILYVYYLYTESVLEKKEEKKYFILLSVLLGISMYLHPMGFFHTVAALGLFTIFLWIKEKQLPMKWKTVGIGMGIFIVMLAIFPYQTGSVFMQFFTKGSGAIETANQYDRLLYWFKQPAQDVGVNPSYFSFSLMHGFWTLPFLLIGIGFCLFLRKRKHLFFLAWLFSLYFVIHADVIGKGPFVHRSLSASAHIFIPLTIIGFYYLVKSLSKLVPKKIVSGAVVIIFLFFALSVNAKIPFEGAKKDNLVVPALVGSYDNIGRMNPDQFGAASWMLENLPKDTNVTDIGLINLNRARWIAGVAHHINDPYAPKTSYFPNRSNMGQYVMVDYSDLKRMTNQETLNVFLSWEKNTMANDKVLYNEHDIRIYEVNKAIKDRVNEDINETVKEEDKTEG